MEPVTKTAQMMAQVSTKLRKSSNHISKCLSANDVIADAANNNVAAPKSHPPNAMTVQVEVHSSSSGAGSGSDESLSVSSGSDDVQQKARSPIMNGSPAIMTNNNNSTNNNLADQHDYEDIYLVREEARTTTKAKYGPGRSRSRDSGSHSRSASASSNHSGDIVVQYGGNVSIWHICKLNLFRND